MPVVIAWDIDPNDGFTTRQKVDSLRAAIDLCDELDARATFPFVDREASHYASEILKLQRLGHEIGCRGHTHGNDEEYQRLPEEDQRRRIEEATHRLRDLAGAEVTALPRTASQSVG